MKPIKRKLITSQLTNASRPRKLGVLVRNDEFYSTADIAAIKEGTQQIKHGECVSHAELKRLLDV